MAVREKKSQQAGYRDIAKRQRSLSPAEWTGFAAFLLYLPLWEVTPYLALVPLAGFILACGIIPFFPQTSFFLPVISKGSSSLPAVSLTFDDGPDPASTPILLNILEKHKISATFFVTGERARKYAGLVKEIVSRGHTLGNHSYTHDTLIMVRSVDTLRKEIVKTQQVLEELGFRVRLFRPPVGITTSRHAYALEKTGLQVVNFSRRAGDMGNRRVKGIARKILKKLRAGDIVLLHDVPPGSEDQFRLWLAEVERLLEEIREKGFDIVPLETFIGQPVMEIFHDAKNT